MCGTFKPEVQLSYSERGPETPRNPAIWEMYNMWEAVVSYDPLLAEREGGEQGIERARMCQA